jgi:hypothetical protein
MNRRVVRRRFRREVDQKKDASEGGVGVKNNRICCFSSINQEAA